MVDEATTATVETTTTAAAATDWRESIPTELRGEKSLASFKDIGGLAKSYVEAQKMIGGSIRLPKEDAPAEEKTKFFRDTMSKFGLPATAEQYAWKKPEGFTGEWDEAGVKAFLPIAHEIGLTNAQVQRLIDWQAGTSATSEKAAQAAKDKAYNEAETALKTKWGAQFDAKITLAKQAVGSRGEAFQQKLIDAGLDNDPDMLDFLASVGGMMAEDGIIVGPVDGASNAEQARMKLNEIYANKDHPYWRGDQKAQDEVLALTRIEQGMQGQKVVATFG